MGWGSDEVVEGVPSSFSSKGYLQGLSHWTRIAIVLQLKLLEGGPTFFRYLGVIWSGKCVSFNFWERLLLQLDCGPPELEKHMHQPETWHYLLRGTYLCEWWSWGSCLADLGGCPSSPRGLTHQAMHWHHLKILMICCSLSPFSISFVI